MAGLFFLSGCIGAGSNSNVHVNDINHFPQMMGITLEGKGVSLPFAFQGQVNVVVVGFQREHQGVIESWLSVLRKFEDTLPKVRFYEVPVIQKTHALKRLWINNAMRRGVPDSKDRKRTITVYIERDRFLQTLGMDPRHIYLLVLDAAGKIIGRVEGPFSPQKASMLEFEIRKTLDLEH
jgi:hypothetical protein